MAEIETRAGTATILFTDLVGSTQMRTHLGDVTADDVRRLHDQILGREVELHGGTLIKSLGDGILATFGAAADAVDAATAMQSAIEYANRRVQDERRLAIRVGLSAGDVGWEDGDVHGTPVVIASRLCDRAIGGQILVDDLVRGLARGRTTHQFRIVGELELKGIGEPVTAYEVPWELVVGQRAPLPAPLLPVGNELPFAGRDTERRALAEQWKSTQTDGKSVALVSGEPGVGKTRLTAELARTAYDDGGWVVAGRCDDSISAPFTPWLEILRYVVAHASVELLADHVDRHGGDLTLLVPELERRVDDVPKPRALDAETKQLALYDAVVDIVRLVAADAPLMLVIDDAHWADASTLALLRHTVRRLPPSSPVLALVTYRDTDVDRTHPLSAMIGDLRREPRVTSYPLRGIDEAGVCALLTAAGGHELDELGIQFARTLERETEGNPFFVGEVLRHLVETGVIVQEDGLWRGSVTSIDEIGIPEGVRDVVGRRLSRLSDDANATLRVAAVVGREFSVAVVAEVTARGEDAVLDDLESAIAASLVNEVPGSPGRMSFSHALVQSTLADELSTTRRVRLHAAVAAVLESDPRTPAAELAHHYAEAAAAGLADKAVEHARRAAIEAHTRLAFDEELRFFDVALEVLDDSADNQPARAELLIERGWVQHLRDDQVAGRADALAAAEIARRIDSPALLARSGVTYQGALGHWATPSDPIAVDLMSSGLARLDPDDLSTRANTMAALANALLLVPGDEALKIAEEAETIARRGGADEALARAYSAHAWALRSRGRGDEVCAVANEGIEQAVRLGRLDWEWGIRYQLVEGLLELGDVDRAVAETERVHSVPSQLKGWGPVALEATMAMAEGRFADVESTIERAAALGVALGDTNEAIRGAQHTQLAVLQGRADDALRWCRHSEATLLGAAICMRPAVLAEIGDLDGARELYQQWARDVRPLAPQILEQWNLAYEASLAMRLGDAELGARVSADLEPFRGHFLGGDTSMMGPAESPLARAAIAQGRYDAAIELAEYALVQIERRGWNALGTQQRIDLGRARLARAAPEDVYRAPTLLGEAIERADALGMALATAEARSLLA